MKHNYNDTKLNTRLHALWNIYDNDVESAMMLIANKMEYIVIKSANSSFVIVDDISLSFKPRVARILGLKVTKEFNPMSNSDQMAKMVSHFGLFVKKEGKEDVFSNTIWNRSYVYSDRIKTLTDHKILASSGCVKEATCFAAWLVASDVVEGVEMTNTTED